jgi:YegS/Rv2252/BmrU family lipid kinase
MILEYFVILCGLNMGVMDEFTGKWMVVVNPNSGKRKGKKDWHKIHSLLHTYKLNFDAVFTEGPRHAIEIAKRKVDQGYRQFIVIGGDGTMNEVINGLFQQSSIPTTEVIIGMITVGTGNDWGKMFGIPLDYEKAIQTLLKRKIMAQDAGVVQYHHASSLQKRFFVNIAGIGFDAFVVNRTNKLKAKGRSNTFTYISAVLTSLFRYRHSHAVVDMDGHTFRDSVFSMSIAIGKYCGNGMMQTPDAIADDGLFDVTLIKKIGRGNVLRNIGKLYNGKIINHPRVDTYKGKSIYIDSDPIIHLETDGESLGHSPFRFDILPSSVSVIYGN